MQINARVSLFRMVKDKLIASIIDGSLIPGEFLPSLRQLRKKFNVSMNTIKHALRELQEEDWLVSHPRRGIAVANPLPGISRLHMVKRDLERSRSPALSNDPFQHNARCMVCLLDNDSLRPPFEWAKREYAEALGPFKLEIKSCTLSGRDDGARTEADILLLPSWAVSRFALNGTITPAEDILHDTPMKTDVIPPELMKLSQLDGKLWGMPIMAGAYTFIANAQFFERTQTAPDQLTSVTAMLDAIDRAPQPGANDKPDGRSLFGFALPVCILLAAGHAYPGAARVPDLLTSRSVREILERIKRVIQRPDVIYQRFDHEGDLQLDQTCAAFTVTGKLCMEKNQAHPYQVLPIPLSGNGRPIVATYCLCVSAHSLHPFEAWEWIARLTKGEFLERLAGLGVDLPVVTDPRIWTAFGKVVGNANADMFQRLLARPSAAYGIHKEDVITYLWEVMHHEIHRFLTGQNDYAEMLRRVEVKTHRFLQRDNNTSG